MAIADHKYVKIPSLLFQYKVTAKRRHHIAYLEEMNLNDIRSDLSVNHHFCSIIGPYPTKQILKYLPIRDQE